MANETLTPEQIAAVQAKLLQSCNGHPNAEIPWPHYILHQAHDAIEQLQRQLAELRADHKRACFSLRDAERELAEARKDALEEAADMIGSFSFAEGNEAKIIQSELRRMAEKETSDV